MDTGDDGPQNVYDDPRFFAGYVQLDRFKSATWGAGIEHAMFRELVGDVVGRRVLDLGCGGGHLAIELAETGAADVLAIDASERMLEVARTQRTHPKVSYRLRALEDASFPQSAFDLVVSSLALHYVGDYAALMRRIAAWLAPGGALVVSVEHPIFTARASADGWATAPDGRRTGWVIDRYAEQDAREHEWFVAGVRRYHRPMSVLLNGVLDAGLSLTRVEEPAPGAEWLRHHPQHTDERTRPMFLLWRAVKLG